MLGNYLGLLNERLDQFFAFDLGSAEMSRSAHLQRPDPNDWLGRKLNLPTPAPPEIMLNNVKISLFLSTGGGGEFSECYSIIKCRQQHLSSTRWVVGNYKIGIIHYGRPPHHSMTPTCLARAPTIGGGSSTAAT